jgi:hypothetical protein
LGGRGPSTTSRSSQNDVAKSHHLLRHDSLSGRAAR